ncbi:MAG: antitoxin MazE family protein [Sphingopyxis sp.]|nr:antitoxin MazE family protein [Sphingopyxis sp.]
MGVHERMTGAERVAKRRAALRATGLRPRQFWLPDLANPTVQAKLANEARHIHRLDAASDVGAFLESIRAETWADERDYDWGPDGPPIPPERSAARPE